MLSSLAADDFVKCETGSDLAIDADDTFGEEVSVTVAMTMVGMLAKQKLTVRTVILNREHFRFSRFMALAV